MTFDVGPKERMSALLDALDLAGFDSVPLDSPRTQFGLKSRFLRKSSGSCDDEFYARNLWPCCASHCHVVLGPLDAVFEDQRCCHDCNSLQRDFEILAIVIADLRLCRLWYVRHRSLVPTEGG